MPSKYFHCSSFDGVVMSSWSTGRYLFVNVLGSSIHSLSSSLLLDTFNPSTNVALLLTSPLTVLIVMDVFCPFTPRSLSSFSNMNVPWLQLSSNAYVFTVFPEWLYLRFIGTMHMLITFPPVLAMANFTATSFGVSALSFFWLSFCFFFLTYQWSLAGCLPLHTLHILQFAQNFALCSLVTSSKYP